MHGKLAAVLLTTAGFVALPYAVRAQEASYKAGETVEAKSYFFNPPWHAAIILSVGAECDAPRQYRIKFVGPDAGDHGNPCVGAGDLRRPAGEAAPIPVQPRPAEPNRGASSTPAAQPVNEPARRPEANGAFGVGSRVDVINPLFPDKAARGTIVESSGGRYKIHYDGCDPRRDAYEERANLFPAATISTGAPDITFLTGSWAMFTPSYPNTIVNGNTILREYGMGAKAPPLQINANGTYTWYFDFGKPPVNGRWSTHAKIDGVRYGTEVVNGVIIKDPTGAEWKVYRRKLAGDNADHITAQTMCSGMTVIGTRVR